MEGWTTGILSAFSCGCNLPDSWRRLLMADPESQSLTVRNRDSRPEAWLPTQLPGFKVGPLKNGVPSLDWGPF